MVRNIEVELRGPLDRSHHGLLITTEDFRDLLAKESAMRTATETRFLLDLSTDGVELRDIDIRVRSTNGRVELVVKKGSMGQAAREEALLVLQGKQLEEAIRLCAMLGYPSGVACDRRIIRYRLDSIEIAEQEVRYFDNPDRVHSRFYEAEIVTDLEGKDQAEKFLRAWLSERGIPVYDKQEWDSYVLDLNNHVNGRFTFGKSRIDHLQLYIEGD